MIFVLWLGDFPGVEGATAMRRNKKKTRKKKSLVKTKPETLRFLFFFYFQSGRRILFQFPSLQAVSKITQQASPSSPRRRHHRRGWQQHRRPSRSPLVHLLHPRPLLPRRRGHEGRSGPAAAPGAEPAAREHRRGQDHGGDGSGEERVVLVVREQSQPLGTARTKAEPLEQQQTQPLSLFFGAFFVFVVFLFPGSGEGEEGGRESEKEEEVEKVGEAEVDLISTTHLHCPTRPFSSHVSA